MKYLCKKPYSDDFIVGNYYEGNDYTSDKIFMINGYLFFKYKNDDSLNSSWRPFMSDYFYSMTEIREKKINFLNKLK